MRQLTNRWYQEVRAAPSEESEIEEEEKEEEHEINVS